MKPSVSKPGTTGGASSTDFAGVGLSCALAQQIRGGFDGAEVEAPCASTVWPLSAVTRVRLN